MIISLGELRRLWLVDEVALVAQEDGSLSLQGDGSVPKTSQQLEAAQGGCWRWSCRTAQMSLRKTKIRNCSASSGNAPCSEAPHLVRLRP